MGWVYLYVSASAVYVQCECFWECGDLSSSRVSVHPPLRTSSGFAVPHTPEAFSPFISPSPGSLRKLTNQSSLLCFLLPRPNYSRRGIALTSSLPLSLLTDRQTLRWDSPSVRPCFLLLFGIAPSFTLVCVFSSFLFLGWIAAGRGSLGGSENQRSFLRPEGRGGGGRSSGSRFLTVKEARQKLTQAELDSMITKVDTRESKDILLLSLSLILPSFLCLLPRVFREDDVCAESFFQCPRSSSLLSAPLPARAMALVVVCVSLAKTRRRE